MENKARVFLLCLFLPVCFTSALAADNGESPWVRKLIFGIVFHDRGPASDNHEGGVDPNWEFQLNAPRWQFWRWIGSPVPMFGATPNFSGDTSVFYGGINYEFNLSNKMIDGLTYNLTRNMFVAGGVSAALHNGPLHKDSTDCDNRSDCGFGYRVLPRLNVEIGFSFKSNHAISLFYDHMSHKGVLGGENEGIDHIGLRYHYTFKSR
jgi:hypothetical protein